MRFKKSLFIATTTRFSIYEGRILEVSYGKRRVHKIFVKITKLKSFHKKIKKTKYVTAYSISYGGGNLKDVSSQSFPYWNSYASVKKETTE